jgi:hypothetical protein
VYTAVPPDSAASGTASSDAASPEAAVSDAASATAAPWGVVRATRREFPEPAAQAGDPAYAARLRVYLTDLLRPYPVRLDLAALERGGQSYGEMAESLIRATVPADEPVDLLVLAHAVPDIAPGRATATYLSHVCPGGPLAFGLSDQGTAAAFTGLRLMREYARTDGLRRALLLVVEQSLLPFDPAPPGAPTTNAGVALLLGDAPASAPAPDAFPPPAPCAHLSAVCVLPDTPPDALAGELAALPAPPAAGTTAILGAALAPQAHTLPAPGRDGVDRVRIAPAGQPTTGVWWELADEVRAAADGPRRLLLADYDPDSRSLCLAALRLGDPR